MIDKRKDKRVREENRVCLEVPNDADGNGAVLANAFTSDISLGGARILTDRLFQADSSLRMTLFLSKSKQILRVRAEVRWTREVAPGLYEMGVRFEHGVPTSVMGLLNHLYRKEPAIPTHVST